MSETKNIFDLFRSGFESFGASNPATVVAYLQATVEIKPRIECIESMYLPFKNVVATSVGDTGETFYFMWWDMILHTFGPMPNQYKYGYLTLTAGQERMIDAIYHTLARILTIDHRGGQMCALHGMGHLYHPLKEELVQRYLDEHRTELNAEDLQWVEGCRDGCVQRAKA